MKDEEYEMTEYECDSCDGTGTIEIYYDEYDIYDEMCPKCEGAGVIYV